MYDDEEDEPNDSLSMSFLDVISCGMLSAVFLALIFSIVGQKPPTLLQTHDFIQITFSVPKNDARVWNVALTPPGEQGKEVEYAIPMREFNLDSVGRLVGAGEETEKEEVKQLRKYGVRLLGFQRRFYNPTPPNEEVANPNAKPGDEKQTATRMIIISEPTVGQWKARIFLRDGGEFPSDKDVGEPSDFSVNLSNNKSVKVEGPKKEFDADGKVISLEFSWEYN